MKADESSVTPSPLAPKSLTCTTSCNLEVTVRTTAPAPSCKNVAVPVNCCVHTLVAVQRYMFSPAVASVAKNAAPCVQVAGNWAVVPRLAGIVEVAPEASQGPI
jgi:hypothetical protein